MTTTKKFWYYAFALVGAIFMLFSSCEKDDDDHNGQQSIPVLSTTEVTEITQTTAISGGNITDDGNATVTARGVCWSTSQNPTINDSKTEDGTGVGEFESGLAGLSINTTYYVRAYATNDEGTSYGDQKEFTTEGELATVITAEITEITSTSAISGGNVTHGGGVEVTARGVVWSTSEEPTIANSDGITSDGDGDGEFTSSITDLESNTTYYVRAYATNSQGIAYGNQIFFISAPQLNSGEVWNPTTGKIWMDKNLGATRVATSSTDANAYGDLYQWGRGADGHQIRTSSTTPGPVSSDNPGHGYFLTGSIHTSLGDWRNPRNDNLWQGINGVNNPCPNGYRLPTSDEWNDERRSWSSNDAAGAFDSPLKLPLAGFRTIQTGSVSLDGSAGFYWSSSISDGYSKLLSIQSSQAFIRSGERSLGLSVRCIKD